MGFGRVWKHPGKSLKKALSKPLHSKLNKTLADVLLPGSRKIGMRIMRKYGLTGHQIKQKAYKYLFGTSSDASSATSASTLVYQPRTVSQLMRGQG